MGTGVLIKYGASAGSGKTTELAFRFLLKLFTSKGPAYRKILAVTFTNKAAAEMKLKILDQLYFISKGEITHTAEKLMGKTGFTFDTLQAKSKEILFSILHDYSFVNIGTIDSFFQHVLRVFTKEIGLHHGYLIEIDHKYILSQAVADTVDDVADDESLLKWLTRYALERIEEGKNWNIQADIGKLAEEIFRETFRLMTDEEKSKLQDRNLLNNLIEDLKEIKKKFASELKNRIEKCRSILDKHAVTDDMFFGGSRGSISAFMRKYLNENISLYEPLPNTLDRLFDDPPLWTAKGKMTGELNSALKDGFGEQFIDLLQFYNNNYVEANSASLILENIYILGILSDILKNVRNITSAENKFLLSDSGELLYRLIGSDQTPFIYEKAGNIFENFMIDEFQDTSVIQWNNFLPLILNSMANGHDNLIVGDVKQSIYRWRNGDWRIMYNLEKQIDRRRITDKKLLTNYRSLKNIVEFNNSLFSVLPSVIEESHQIKGDKTNLSKLYIDACQKCPEGKEGGYIKIEFIKSDDIKSFEEVVLEKLPSLIENLQDSGYRASDIGILVRFNSEGARVINSIIEYRSKADDEKKEKYNYSIVSGDSLFLNKSHSVSFIIALFGYLLNPDDKISKAVMVRNYLMAIGKTELAVDITNFLENIDKIFPQGWNEFINKLKQKSVYEAVENIIHFFNLGVTEENCAFLSAFQNLVYEFSINNSSDIPSFIEWWTIYGAEKSLSLSDYQDSIKVMTIHKAKGLEFKALIIPFISWHIGHGRENPIIWIRHEYEPLKNIGPVPVKYKKALQYSIFENDYYYETLYSNIDNLNLLYVAFTRPKEVLTGFCYDGKETTVASWVKQAFLKIPEKTPEKIETGNNYPLLNLYEHYNKNDGVFIAGELPECKTKGILKDDSGVISTSYYFVNDNIKSLRLRFHGENWFTSKEDRIQIKLNYGKIMHEILASVITIKDIKVAVEKMVVDGRIGEEEGKDIIGRLADKVRNPLVSDWFNPENKVLTEPEILTPGGAVYRPDRVIFLKNKIILVDFKFGTEEKKHYEQVTLYRKLLQDMGYKNVEAFLWYVDDNVIRNVE